MVNYSRKINYILNITSVRLKVFKENNKNKRLPAGELIIAYLTVRDGGISFIVF